VAIFALTPAGAPAQIQDLAIARLEPEITRLAGICWRDHRRVSFGGAERFPMASTYKMAVQVLTRVDRGQLTLDQRVDRQAAGQVYLQSRLFFGKAVSGAPQGENREAG
jgi:beta-lactamase class A